MIVDTSALLAFFDRSEPAHIEVAAVLEAATSEELVVSPYVLTELDYLVASRHGVAAELLVLEEMSAGAWELPHVEPADIARAAQIIRRYKGQQIGLADASNVVLADRYRTRTVLTLDHRHFDVLHPLRGGRFRVLP